VKKPVANLSASVRQRLLNLATDDVGLGDTIVPGPEELEYPTLLQISCTAIACTQAHLFLMQEGLLLLHDPPFIAPTYLLAA
jgi:hypothetical protein